MHDHAILAFASLACRFSPLVWPLVSPPLACLLSSIYVLGNNLVISMTKPFPPRTDNAGRIRQEPYGTCKS